jgi:RsiW-degrading membrane proteinase PrsW (M82 family)
MRVWEATTVTVGTVWVFAGAWLSGRGPWAVGVVTVAAALLVIGSLAALGPTLSDRFASVLAHALLGLLALFAALVVLPILMFRADLRARRKNDKLE